VGDPEVRLREDPVRLLRAVRFSARLGLDIEPRTYAAMEGAVEDLARCAQPRLLDNTLRMLRGSAAEHGIQLLHALGALRPTLPPLAHFLDEGGAEAAKAVAAHAKALDERTRAGFQWDEAQLLAAVLLPLARAAPISETVEGKVSTTPAVDALLEEWVRAARFPRKWAERCRGLLWAQRTLSGERRRRGSLNSFRTHPLFEDALALFELSVEATGQFAPELAAWKEGKAPMPAEGAPALPRKRRRRRRRGGAGASAQPPSSPAAGESAGAVTDFVANDSASELEPESVDGPEAVSEEA
jgi:poly(A) polymerase